MSKDDAYGKLRDQELKYGRDTLYSDEQLATASKLLGEKPKESLQNVIKRELMEGGVDDGMAGFEAETIVECVNMIRAQVSGGEIKSDEGNTKAVKAIKRSIGGLGLPENTARKVTGDISMQVLKDMKAPSAGYSIAPAAKQTIKPK